MARKGTVAEDLSFLTQGVSLSFLSSLFRMDRRYAALKLSGVRIISREPHVKYDFSQAVTKLARPDPEQIAEYVKAMRPNDLPPMMQAEFWQGQLRRQKFMVEAGDLWKTTDVLDMLTDVFKTVRVSSMLMADTVARETQLTSRQRTIISELADAMLDDLRERLIDNPEFAKFRNQREEAVEMFSEDAGFEHNDVTAASPLDPDGSDDDADGWAETTGATFG